MLVGTPYPPPLLGNASRPEEWFVSLLLWVTNVGHLRRRTASGDDRLALGFFRLELRTVFVLTRGRSRTTLCNVTFGVL